LCFPLLWLGPAAAADGTLWLSLMSFGGARLTQVKRPPRPGPLPPAFLRPRNGAQERRGDDGPAAVAAASAVHRLT